MKQWKFPFGKDEVGPLHWRLTYMSFPSFISLATYHRSSWTRSRVQADYWKPFPQPITNESTTTNSDWEIICTPACLFAFIQQSLITVIFPYLHRINVVFMWDRQLNEVDDIPLRAVQTTIYLVLGRSVHSQKGLQKLPTFPPIRCCSWYVGLSCTDLAILQWWYESPVCWYLRSFFGVD